MSFPTDQRLWRPHELDIEVTARCNLGCHYCYLTKSPPGDRRDMTGTVCDFVLRYTERLAKFHEPLKGEFKVNWNLFGGEPFCAFSIIEYLVGEARARGLPVHIEVFTNGATANPWQVEWCKRNGVHPKRSVGGCPEACAIVRPGNYLDLYEAETEWWQDWGVMRRVTVVPETARYVMDTLRYFYNRGYWGGIDFATDDYAEWSPEATATLKDQLWRVAREFVRQFKAGHVMANERLQLAGRWLFQQPPMLNLRCGAGWGVQGITWDGYIVPCHRFLREPRKSAFCGGWIGDILSGFGPSFGPEFTQAILAASRTEESETCLACPARLPCQHGCYHVSLHTTGNLDTSPPIRCEIARHYVELAKWMHGEIAGLDPRWWAADAEKCDLIPKEA